MAKRIDPKAKAKKQKIYAAIGGVILLGVLAFQVPRTMKMLNQQGVDSSSSSSTSAPATTTTTAGTAAVVSSSGGGGLTDPDAVPLPQSGQLLAFGRFRTKDPFAQQLDSTCNEGDTSCAASSSPAKTSTSAKAAPVVPSGAAPKKSTASNAAARTRAFISVNGVVQKVTLGGSFPSSDPAFTLVSLTATTAKIGISGGSFESGQPALTLKKGKPLTLMNTADGTRYVLRLLSTS